MYRDYSRRGGAATCDPVATQKSCAQWRADRNAGNLVPGCPVIANDVGWVVAGGVGTFTALPTRPNSLPEDGWYESPALNPGQPWAARMDWDNCRVYWMHDATTNENEVHGDTQVQNFPWGNNQVQRNHINQANFNYSGGAVRDNYFGPQTNVVVSGGSVTETRVDRDANLSVSGGSVSQVRVSAQSNLTVTGGSVADTEIDNDSTVSLANSGRILDSEIKGASTVLVDGGNFDVNEVTGAAYIDLRTFSGNFQRNTVHRGRIYLAGTNGNVTDNAWDSLSYLFARNVTGLIYRYCSSNGYSYVNIDGARNWNTQYVGLRDVSYIYGRNSVNVSGIRWTGTNQATFDFDNADGLRVQYAVVEGSATFRAERATGRLRYIDVKQRSYLNASEFTGDWFDLKLSNASTLTIVRASDTSSYRIVVENQSNINATDSASRWRRNRVSAHYWDDRNGANTILDCDFSQGVTYTRNGSAEYQDCGGKAYPYLNGIGAPAGRAIRIWLDSYGRFRCNAALAGWSAIDNSIRGQSDLRMQSAGRVQRSEFSARGIMIAAHTGTIDRAVIMQTFTTQTAASGALRLHAGGVF